MEFNPLEEIRTSFTRVSPVRQHLRAILFLWAVMKTKFGFKGVSHE